MSQKAKYIEWIKGRKDIPIFFQPWYLDLVSTDNAWDVILYDDGNEIKAVFPFCYKKKLGFNKIVMPALLPYLGPWILYALNESEYEKRSLEKKAMQYCISKLPSFDDFRQKFYPTNDNWLPFYWAGFEQTTRYTYIIPYEEKKDIKSNYKDSLKRQIAKTKKGCSFEIVDDLLPYEALFNATFKRQNLANPLDFKFLCHFLKTINANGSGKCVVAKGVDNQLLAIVLVVWDNLSTYYLAVGYDEKYALTGAMSGLFDLMIEEAQTQKRNFNFEGSMIESIEQYFRSFGAQLQPVMNIWKTNSKVLKTFGK